MTDAELRLWYHLRANRFAGIRFKRQHPLAGYIVDFVSLSHRLVIEADGGQHLESTRDIQRDQDLQLLGYRVLRFWNDEVLKNTDGVLEAIRLALQAPLPYPSPASGRGEHQE